MTDRPLRGPQAPTLHERNAAGTSSRRSARLRHWLVVVPLLTSGYATALLLILLVLDGPAIVVVGSLLGPFLVNLWQARPGATGESGPAGSFRFLLLLTAGLVLADALALGVGALTGRLPAWGLPLAVVLLSVHLVWSVRVVAARDRLREELDAGAVAPPAPELRWLFLPAPLRATVVLASGATAVALVAFVIDSWTGGSAESSAVLVAGALWGTSLVPLGLCLALDVRGSAAATARRSQAARGHRGPLASPERLPQMRRYLRCTGVVVVLAGGAITGIFWPSQ